MLTTVKQTKRGLRIWCENQAFLKSAGFMPHAKYGVHMFPDGLVLQLMTDQEASKLNGAVRKVSACKRNGKDRAVIDIHQKYLPFNAGDSVELSSGPNQIYIQGVNHENS